MPRKHITFPPPRYPEITKADDSLLRRISTTADSGDEATRYLAALRQIMQTQNGYLSSANHQDYYPGDAIELCAERANDNAAAFTLCHLIIIQSALAQTCPFTLSYYWEHYPTQRAQLPPRLQDQLDTAYQHAHKHGLIDDTFRPPSP